MKENIENIDINEILPQEQYTFNFEENEIREIHKKQLKPTIRFCVLIEICLVLAMTSNLIWDVSDVRLGICIGAFLIVAIMYLRGIVSFCKSAKTARATMLMHEYVYSVFEETLKIDVFEQGNKISEYTRRYSEIQSVNDIGAYLLLTLAGHIFVIRKSDLAADSRLSAILEAPMKKGKVSQKRRNIVLAIALICLTVGIVLSMLGEFSEKFTKDQVMESMKAAVEKTYDEYELLTCFNIHKDGRFTDAFILVESDGKIDVLGYATQNGEAVTVEKYLGLTPESEDVTGYLADGSAVIMRIYPNEIDIPDIADIKIEFQYRNQIMYFCITFSEE